MTRITTKEKSENDVAAADDADHGRARLDDDDGGDDDDNNELSPI